ncbi:hypothetical protein [Methylotuvimicrobium buryatense]|uniref:Uncharacterized protein n=1 Tax=Methylotuvimicrobium buryatense TaxID=95641 RepID=A0A4P9ULN3_METBY|nr:hypothetical protein [Methylotuvimicrobium buryatense]QCW82108.1 hypothetical protein EQU24_07505 [Methylotuvimicrobium buryatense]
MNKALLEAQIKTVITHYHAPIVRYRHLAFSSKNFAVLEQVTHILQMQLPHYTVWNGEKPDISVAPSLPCPRQYFIAQAFDAPHTGLIISQPDYWLSRWDILDKQAFWSALSTRHGGHPVIVVFAEGDSFAKINQHYFSPHALDAIPVTSWVSTKTALC